MDVDVGLYIGIAFSLLLVIFRSQRARSSVLGNIPGTSIYEDVKACEQAKEFETIKIIRYEESIYYANVENFRYKVYKLAKVSPAEVIAKIKKEKGRQAAEARKAAKAAKKNKSAVADPENQPTPEVDIIAEEVPIRHLIIDCSCVNFIDSQGVYCIQQVRFCSIYASMSMRISLFCGYF